MWFIFTLHNVWHHIIILCPLRHETERSNGRIYESHKNEASWCKNLRTYLVRESWRGTWGNEPNNTHTPQIDLMHADSSAPDIFRPLQVLFLLLRLPCTIHRGSRGVPVPLVKWSKEGVYNIYSLLAKSASPNCLERCKTRSTLEENARWMLSPNVTKLEVRPSVCPSICSFFDQRSQMIPITNPSFSPMYTRKGIC